MTEKVGTIVVPWMWSDDTHRTDAELSEGTCGHDLYGITASLAESSFDVFEPTVATPPVLADSHEKPVHLMHGSA
jgi:hypothetical protein